MRVPMQRTEEVGVAEAAGVLAMDGGEIDERAALDSDACTSVTLSGEHHLPPAQLPQLAARAQCGTARFCTVPTWHDGLLANTQQHGQLARPRAGLSANAANPNPK